MENGISACPFFMHEFDKTVTLLSTIGFFISFSFTFGITKIASVPTSFIFNVNSIFLVVSKYTFPSIVSPALKLYLFRRISIVSLMGDFFLICNIVVTLSSISFIV